jgi:SPW repeat
MNRFRTLRIPDRRPVAAAAIFMWVALSPWVWGFADSHAAVANHVALVFGFAPLALIMVNLRAAAFVTLLGGIWLAISPWVLGYAIGHSAWLSELVSGLALIVLSLDAADVRFWRRAPSRATTKHGSSAAVAKTAGSRS